VQKQQSDDDNRTEMANMLYGDFLTENPACAQSAFGAHRVIPDRWKGMTPEQLAEIRRVQDIQRKEAQVTVASAVCSARRLLCLSVSQLVRPSCCLQCFDAVGWAAGRASGL